MAVRLVDIDSLEYNGCYDCPQWITKEQLEEAVIKPARWIEVFDDFVTLYKCNCCGRWQDRMTDYCCHCGREME